MTRVPKSGSLIERPTRPSSWRPGGRAELNLVQISASPAYAARQRATDVAVDVAAAVIRPSVRPLNYISIPSRLFDA